MRTAGQQQVIQASLHFSSEQFHLHDLDLKEGAPQGKTCKLVMKFRKRTKTWRSLGAIAGRGC